MEGEGRGNGRQFMGGTDSHRSGLEFCLLPLTEGSRVPVTKAGAGGSRRSHGSERDCGGRIRSLLCIF